MRIDFSKIKLIPEARQTFSFTEEMDPAAGGFDEYRLVRPLSCQGEAVHEGDAFLVRGKYASTAALQCSRCGRRFESPVSGEFSVRFQGGAPTDESGEEAVYALEGDQADLGPVLLSEIFFSLPMQPLCREDCRGLCPCCGTDLNEGSCSCRREDIDPRWEKLKGFIKQNESS